MTIKKDSERLKIALTRTEELSGLSGLLETIMKNVKFRDKKTFRKKLLAGNMLMWELIHSRYLTDTLIQSDLKELQHHIRRL